MNMTDDTITITIPRGLAADGIKLLDIAVRSVGLEGAVSALPLAAAIDAALKAPKPAVTTERAES